MDKGHRQTNNGLKDLEKRIRAEYRRAEKEIEQKTKDYLNRFAEKDKRKKAQLRSGEITKKEYDYWRTGQIAIGQRWSEMKDTLAKDLLSVNEKARSMTQGFSYDAYALNHNYGTFEVEKGSLLDTSYTLYDRHTVERLVRDNPDMLPAPGKKTMQAIREGREKLWNKQQLQSVMLQGILQGESIPKLAERLAKKVGDSNMKAAIRNARTMTTRAENYGRLNSYKRAEGLGIEMKKQWVATLDHRTRDSHVDVDGEIRNIDEAFSNGLDCPGGMGPPEEVYNCRCTLIGKVEGAKVDANNINLRNDNKLGSMSYEEWYNRHKIDDNHFVGFKYQKGGTKIKIVDKGNIAHAYTLSKENGVDFPNGGGGIHKTETAAVFTSEDGVRIIYSANNNVAKQDLVPSEFLHIYQNIPENYRNMIQNEIYIVDYRNPQDPYWRKKYKDKNFRSYATGGDNITFYAFTNHDPNMVRDTIYHEGAHYIDGKSPIKQNISNLPEWGRAVAADAKLGYGAVTAYAELVAKAMPGYYAEDFAESVQEFFVRRKEFIKKYPNRTKLIKKELRRNGWTGKI